MYNIYDFKEKTMKQYLRILLFALLFLIPSTLAAEEDSAPCGMKFIIVKPQGFDPSKPAPVLFCLHGVGDNPNNFMQVCEGKIQWISEYVRIYPYPTDPQAFANGDEHKFANVAEYLMKKYKVSRVVVFGFSRGGCMAMQFGLAYPNLVNGVIAHSGNNPYHKFVHPTPDARRLAIALIHGKNDQAVPISFFEEAVKGFQDKKYKWTKFTEVPNWPHSVHFPSVAEAHAWLLDVFKKGGGGGGVTKWNDKDVKEVLKESLARLGEKKTKDLDPAKEAHFIIRALGYKSSTLDPKMGKQVVDKLLPLTKKSDREVQLYAIKSIGLGGPESIQHLKKILDKEKDDEEAYLAAVYSLGYAGPNALPVLYEIMKKDSFDFKAAQAAVEAITKIRSSSSAPVLLEFLKELEKDGGKKASALLETVQTALKMICMEKFTASAEWEKYLNEKK
jgi:predicted esterase